MKKLLSVLLVSVLCFAVFVIPASAVEANYRLRWDMGSTSNNPAYIEWHVDTQSLEVTYTNSGNFYQLRDTSNPDADQKSKLYIKEGETWNEIPNVTSRIVGVDGERTNKWRSAMYAKEEGYDGSPTYQTVYIQFYKDGEVFKFDGGVEYGVYFEIYTDGYPHGSMPDDIFGFSNPITSGWALSEIGKAEEMGLVPDVLVGADLSQSITRAEFAAVSVKAYEALAGTAALPNTVNPFTDTADLEVLKAYNLGITTGVSDTEFAPDTLLNREQAATMLTRTFKRATMNGWTIQNDAQFALTYEKPAAFADDNDISIWAKESVYFMAANGIINGVGENKFAPKNVTSEEEATGYANATREQALIIAVRMVENLK